MNEPETTTEPEAKSGQATYSPEDNKLRLYIGRVPREEYNKLRREGWVTLHKQREAGGGDFAAVWTPDRVKTCLSYADIIEDEDQGPAERAADRAERFGDYRDKRTGEATGHADRYDSGPSAHGFQSQARADQAAARHDRIADRAGDAWSKAEYWQRRTAGVISHALYLSSPGVRMGRIKTIEADLRKVEKSRAEAAETFEAWRAVSAMEDAEKQTALAERLAGSGYSWSKYTHPRTGKEGSLWDLIREDAEDRISGAEAAAFYMSTHTDPLTPAWNETTSAQWVTHLNLRLSYENQMCEASGGRAALVEMIPGGFIGNRQIRKVVKSPVTGLVVSVEVMGTHSGFTKESGYKEHKTVPCAVLLNVERFKAEAYRAPSAGELETFQAARKAEKEARPKTIKPPLINPTDEDAERLQKLWNERARVRHCATNKERYGKDYAEQFKPSTVCKITQAIYSGNSKGEHSRAKTHNICRNASEEPAERFYDYAKLEAERRAAGPVLCQLRLTSADGSDYGARRVIVLTDKPRKPIPAAVWQTQPVEAVAPEGDLIQAELVKA